MRRTLPAIRRRPDRRRHRISAPHPAILWLLAISLVLALPAAFAPPAWGINEGSLMDAASNKVKDWLKTGEAQEVIWRGDVELGYIGAKGNTNTISTHSRLRVQNDRPNWTHTFRYEIIFAEEEGETTSDLTRASQKSAYKLTRNDYIFETIRYERNADTDYRYRFSEVLGYGRRVVDREKLRVFLESGLGARQTRQPDDTLDSEPLVYGSFELDWDFAEAANFNQNLVVEAGETNTVIDSVSALTAKINTNFHMKLSHSLLHNSNVDPGTAKSDTITSVTLGYNF